MKKVFLTLVISFVFSVSFAQNVGIGTATPNSSALLELNSSNQGFLPPRMTFTQRNAIINPAAGLIIYCVDCDSSGQVQFYNGIKWCNMLGAVASGIIGGSLINSDSATCGADNVLNPLIQYGTMIDQDGNRYKTVKIGTQEWMAENLKTDHYRNGDMIPNVTNDFIWLNLTTGASCWYYNVPQYECPYGKLYNWYAVVDNRQICPIGWHMPSKNDQQKLIKFVDPSADTTCFGCYQSTRAGSKLKSIGTFYWTESNVNATNLTGFSSLPGGFRNDFPGFAGGFVGMGTTGAWWSNSEYDITYAKRLMLVYDYGGSNMDYAPKQVGLSVRCIKD